MICTHIFWPTDQEEFRIMLRMNPDTYEMILARVGRFIRKKHTNYRDAIPEDMRLSITLKYLATGNKIYYDPI